MNGFSEKARLKIKALSLLVRPKSQRHVDLARAAVSVQDFELAQQQWEKALELSPDNLNAQVGLGNVLIRQEKFEQAEAVFRKLSEKFPDASAGYEGLARVANASQNWEQAIKRWELALQLFPRNHRYLIGKIQCLMQLRLYKEANHSLQKGKSIFPNKIELDMAQVRLHRAVYDYQAAYVLLKELTAKDPSNLMLKLELSRSYWDLNDSKTAKNLLEKIRPEIEYASPLFRDFGLLYIDVLLEENESESLQQFLSRRADFLYKNNPKTFTKLCNFLFDSGNFEELLLLIKNIQSEINVSRETCVNHLVSIFEQQKIDCVREKGKLLSEDNDYNKSTSNLLYSLNKIYKYLDKNPELKEISEDLIQALQQISEISSKYDSVLLLTGIYPFEAYTLALRVVERIRTKTPFSLIRLGDGEGNFLVYRDQWQQFQEGDQAGIQTVWWGNVRIHSDELRRIQDEYVTGIQNADILGIPGPYRFCYDVRSKNKLESRNARSRRGIVTILDTLLDPHFCSKINQVSKSDLTLTSCNIHTHFEAWGLWKLILSQIKDCSVISCHEQVDKVLYERYEIEVNKVYKIPSEYRYSEIFDYQDQADEAHYPEGFQRICSDIQVSYPGEVFLVGAGFLGKIYCNIIKQKGGIALDVGSTIDYWLNYKTREWNRPPNLSHYTQYFSEILNRDLCNKATAYLETAGDLIEKGRIEDAILLYRRAILLEPNQSQDIYQTLGEQFLQQNCFYEAEEVFRKLSVQYPKEV